MNNEENEEKFRKVKGNLHDFIHWNKEIQKSLDEQEKIRQYVAHTTDENIKTGQTMLSVFRGFESENYYPEELISNIYPIISVSVSELERAKYYLDDAIDRSYGVTGTIATSDINMATGIYEMRLFFNDNLQIPQITRIYEEHKDQLSSEGKTQKLLKDLEPFELARSLNEILFKIKNLNSEADLTSVGHLLSKFIDDFLKTVAPNDSISNISWIEKESSYYRCIFTIIGYDFKYKKNSPKYSKIVEIAQEYMNIQQRCDIIKHNPYRWDLTKLRSKVWKSFHETINYTLNILNLRSLHFVKNESKN